ncbi:hypothetical protein [Alicyclobacillus sp. ALC3]|uniref:hypothetical protein n=1 Tax=Alicyclobacillus sp. ALC3 TaxID=2796143 RepID=UPI002378C9F7|nr:hypothetical protein [Alicyclobacillus sp. ALC3]WDL99161.1 hypothetical protein JC200_11260 [Alicyclobacillus sp. ALC3]
MLDLLFVMEWMWFSFSISTRGLQLAVLCSGGVVASSYAAAHLSGWMARTFTPPTSHAFLWLSHHISTRPDVISALAGFAPATTVATGGDPLHQALALHILHTLFYFVITIAVFGLFIMMWHFTNALWDREVAGSQRRSLLTVGLSVSCGAYLTALTGILVANVAWLREVPFLAQATTHSFGMAGVEAVVHLLHVV